MPQERLLWIDAREFDWLRYWKARGRPAIVLDDLEDDGDHDPALVYGCFLLNRLGERWPGIQKVMDRLKGERLVYLCPTERGPQWRKMRLLGIEFVARSTSGQRWAMATWAQMAAKRIPGHSQGSVTAFLWDQGWDLERNLRERPALLAFNAVEQRHRGRINGQNWREFIDEGRAVNAAARAVR